VEKKQWISCQNRVREKIEGFGFVCSCGVGKEMEGVKEGRKGKN
jgi:hypothetical protein